MTHITKALQMLHIAQQVEPDGDNALLLLADTIALGISAGASMAEVQGRIRESVETLQAAEAQSRRADSDTSIATHMFGSTASTTGGSY